MRSFTAFQRALLEEGTEGLTWSQFNAASVIEALDAFYRRLDVLIAAGDLTTALQSDITHANRAALDLVSGTNTGDQDLTPFTRADGTVPFTGTVSGVAPTSAAHLATKEYVDSNSAGKSFRIRNWAATVTGTAATLPGTPLSWFDPQVFVNGLLQGSSHYTIVADELTFQDSLSGDDVQVIYAEAIPA